MTFETIVNIATGIVIAAVIAWQWKKLRSEGSYTFEIPSHATITKANGFTYIAIPEEPPEPR